MRFAPTPLFVFEFGDAPMAAFPGDEASLVSTSIAPLPVGQHCLVTNHEPCRALIWLIGFSAAVVGLRVRVSGGISKTF